MALQHPQPMSAAAPQSTLSDDRLYNIAVKHCFCAEPTCNEAGIDVISYYNWALRPCIRARIEAHVEELENKLAISTARARAVALEQLARLDKPIGPSDPVERRELAVKQFRESLSEIDKRCQAARERALEEWENRDENEEDEDIDPEDLMEEAENEVIDESLNRFASMLIGREIVFPDFNALRFPPPDLKVARSKPTPTISPPPSATSPPVKPPSLAALLKAFLSPPLEPTPAPARNTHVTTAAGAAISLADLRVAPSALALPSIISVSVSVALGSDLNAPCIIEDLRVALSQTSSSSLQPERPTASSRGLSESPGDTPGTSIKNAPHPEGAQAALAPSSDLRVAQIRDPKSQISPRRLPMRRARPDPGAHWFTQVELANTFHTTRQNISLHIHNIFAEGLLLPKDHVRSSLRVQTEGSRTITRTLDHYSLALAQEIAARMGESSADLQSSPRAA